MTHLYKAPIRKPGICLKNKLELPSIEFPSIDIPDINIPDIGVPGINLPDIDIPDINMPKFNFDQIQKSPPSYLIVTAIGMPYCQHSHNNDKVTVRYGETWGWGNEYKQVSVTCNAYYSCSAIIRAIIRLDESYGKFKMLDDDWHLYTINEGSLPTGHITLGANDALLYSATAMHGLFDLSSINLFIPKNAKIIIEDYTLNLMADLATCAPVEYDHWRKWILYGGEWLAYHGSITASAQTVTDANLSPVYSTSAYMVPTEMASVEKEKWGLFEDMKSLIGFRLTSKTIPITLDITRTNRTSDSDPANEIREQTQTGLNLGTIPIWSVNYVGYDLEETKRVFNTPAYLIGPKDKKS